MFSPDSLENYERSHLPYTELEHPSSSIFFLLTGGNFSGFQAGPFLPCVELPKQLQFSVAETGALLVSL